jgi:hypothetical protein
MHGIHDSPAVVHHNFSKTGGEQRHSLVIPAAMNDGGEHAADERLAGFFGVKADGTQIPHIAAMSLLCAARLKQVVNVRIAQRRACFRT